MTTVPLIDLKDDPFDLFGRWMAEATEKEPNDPNAMALATATPDGHPSVRMVLLKDWDRHGFVFYTNLDSRKGDEIAANPNASVLFHWKSLRRQIRVEGALSPVTVAEADAYFASRRRISRLGAIASDQSRPLPDRATFEARVADLGARYPEEDSIIPRPENWSGFRMTPTAMEFWQDYPFRLHDRAVWHFTSGTPQQATRLYP